MKKEGGGFHRASSAVQRLSAEAISACFQMSGRPSHKFNVAGTRATLVGLYEDSQPGEILLKMAKEGRPSPG